MKFLKFLYLDVWIPANFYFGVFFSQLAQPKILAEVMVFVGIGWLYFTGRILPHRDLLWLSGVFFVGGIGIGYGLVKLGVPQKGNKMGNAVNKEFMEIIDRLKRIEEKINANNPAS